MEQLFFSGAEVQMVPFIKSIGRNEAAALTPGLAKSWLLSSSFATCIKELVTNLLIICPVGDEPPNS